MNRVEMANLISERVPLLKKRAEFELKEAERLRKQFVTDYPISKIGRLTLDEYVIGKGNINRSFCYRLERELDSLGRILGARADKFGLYYGKTRNDATMKYRFAKHWGANKVAVFKTIKQAIVNLLKAASRDDIATIRESMISPMFKGKLLFIYYPEKFAPIYAMSHLEHFLVQLNLTGKFDSETDMQRALMAYRKRWPAFKNNHACLYMRFLYDLFGYPPEEPSAGTASSVKTPLLSAAIEDAAFINTMPVIRRIATKRTGTGAMNNAEHQKHFKRIGDRGEAIVLEMEKRRLTEAKRKDLATKVKHIATRDDRAGFDILSFDQDGTERPIEVKATMGKTLERGFYITANEVDKASKLPNYYIYFVFSAMSKRPRVLPVKKPKLSGGNFNLKAIAYHATLKMGEQK